MKIIDKLYDQYYEEIDGVIEYSMCAMKYKDNPDLYRMYTDMAKTEMTHASTIYSAILREGEQSIADNDAETVLNHIWELVKERMLCDMAKAQSHIDMAK